MDHRAFLALAASLFLSHSPVKAQDYEPKRITPSFTVDKDTTLLVTLETPKAQADYAVGSRSLQFSQSGSYQESGFQGVFSFPTSGNFPSNVWTLEMIVKVPFASALPDQIPLANVEAATQSMQSSFLLDKAFGVKARYYCWDSREGFHLQPSAGGNGSSIQGSAVDKWIYVAWGADFLGQKYMTAARELTGELLNRDMKFGSTAWVDTNFLSSFPPDQQGAELSRRWLATARRFSLGMPAELNLGHPLVNIKALRISRVFRQELFEIKPNLDQSSTNVWLPADIDRTRAITQTVTRSVGYPGYGNTVPMQVSESFLPLSSGGTPVSLQFTNVLTGLYSLEIHGSVDPRGRTALPRVWNPAPYEFEARNMNGRILTQGRLLAKQSFATRRMQSFHFHVDTPGTVTVKLGLGRNAGENVKLAKLVLVDNLAGLPDKPLKRAQNLALGPANQLAVLTEARKIKDDRIWGALPPLNLHLQVHDQVAQFSAPPAEANVDKWVSKAFVGATYPYLRTFEPLDFTNVTTGATFSHSDIIAGIAWPGNFPDDGTGVFFSSTNYPSLAGRNSYYGPRAELLGHRYHLFFRAIVDDPGSSDGLKLASNYFKGGNPETGHDASMALVRWAYDWPALEMSLHEFRLNTHSPDLEYNTDWSSENVRNGKMFYRGWSGFGTEWLLTAYDQVFPYIRGNQAFADAVNRFIPSVKTPDDVIRLLDRYLVWSSVRDVNSGIIDASANVIDTAGRVLGPSADTAILFDLTRQYSEVYPASGTYQEMYGTALARSGSYYIGSFMVYGFGSAQDLVNKAGMQRNARLAGATVLMDLSDISLYPKVRSAGSFLLDMWVAGGFPFMTGDASGGTHSSREEARNRLNVAKPAIEQAYELYADPRHAWLMANWWTNRSSTVLAAAATVSNPVLHATSRVVPDYGAILEMAPQETNLLKKTSATLRLGIGQGHSHHDFLDLNFFGMGLPLAVDLACRNEGSFWSRPGANWSFLHNHALAHNSEDPNGAGAQTGEPWLRAFAPPVTRASYVDQTSSVKLDRDTVMVETGDTGEYYCFDVQRLSGGTYHTWAFHGCESESLQLNVPMENKTVRWIDRTLEGTQKVGKSTDKLQATWTMTRRTNAYPHTFNGGGIINTVAAEPTVLGKDYNPNLPPVNVRATLLGRGSDLVLQGNPYSEVYAYSFPFLWVQSSNRTDSVYPAIYEWYRGNTPVISNATILSSLPLKVQVQTFSGQEDTFEFNQTNCLAVSRDRAGVRWLKLSGSRPVEAAGVSLFPAADYVASITSINYRTRTLTTSAPLPVNPAVVVGNSGRRIFLQLKGQGSQFTWDDDLLVHEGQLTSARVTSADTISLSSNQQVLFAGMGNRKSESMTVINEDDSWHFRGGKVTRKPDGVTLSQAVFTDANQDGFVNIKTYEIGMGDQISLPADVTVRRATSGWRVKTNVALQGSLHGTLINLSPAEEWQSIGAVIPPVFRTPKPL